MAAEETTSKPAKKPSGPPPPRSVGRYNVIGRLGKGGMAEVLLALEHDTAHDLKRLVVVKKVLAELEQEDPQFRQMFMDEARLASRLNHANVVHTYEVGQDGESPYIAMEFLEGQSLNVLQRRAHSLGQPIAVDVALRIACDMLDGLHYAHELRDFDGKPLGVIHRDVTPSNVFVKYDGSSKLVDFGIAKSSTQREKTRAGMLKGKMAYMAPEQLRDEPINRSADIWAAATVLWEILAGERLFRGKNDFETVQAVMGRELPKLSAKRSDVPASLDAVIAAAIDRDPVKRIQTAEELKNRLEDEAIKMGKPLRNSTVAKVMAQLFGDVIEQNRKMVRDFLEKADAGEFEQNSLRMKTTGAIEIRIATDSGASDRSAPSTTLVRSNLGGDVGLSAEPGSVSGRSYNDGTVVEANPAARLESIAHHDANLQFDDTDDSTARPVWHWIVLTLALLVVGGAVWYALA